MRESEHFLVAREARVYLPFRISRSGDDTGIPTEFHESSPEPTQKKLKQGNWTELGNLLEGSVEEDMLHVNTDITTSSVPSSIWVPTGAGFAKYASEESHGSRVVKLDICDFETCFKKNKKHWWRDASFRSTVVLTSKHQAALNLTY
ncbi:hypothetical protein QAD02_006660 [Eretmocerus hayati]|uniref:Uncharacterized protein n=1 Tax=Eretmocerus hayati TaxID=131215 RepID=A0ACC2N2N4_9HYME|nr:hypothetical protein QAD02_006660 [Eretmocerus hayati]